MIFGVAVDAERPRTLCIHGYPEPLETEERWARDRHRRTAPKPLKGAGASFAGGPNRVGVTAAQTLSP